VLCRRTAVQKLRAYDSVMASLTTMAAFGLLVGGLLGSDFQPFDRTDTKLTLMFSLIMAIMVVLAAVNSLQVSGAASRQLVALHRWGTRLGLWSRK
jgi:hypothetical protein